MIDSGMIVFSDLDGTLLDHHDYSHAAALPALEVLRRNNIPIVLASSKTPSEMAPLRAELGFSHCPAIVENGAGVLAANAPAIASPESYEKLLNQLEDMPKALRMHFVGFSQMTIAEVATSTGLSHDGAVRAKERCFSEPGTWHGNDAQLKTFLAVLSEQGIFSKQGGRFLTLSFGGSKAARMAEIITKMQDETGKKPVSIALGDAPNDLEMLQAANHGVIILNPAHAGIPKLPEEERGQITRSLQPGPIGWNEAVLNHVSHYSH
ncbi:MAG: HAD-IIB family hydrolase [Pseudomonadota bacterium]